MQQLLRSFDGAKQQGGPLYIIEWERIGGFACVCVCSPGVPDACRSESTREHTLLVALLLLCTHKVHTKQLGYTGHLWLNERRGDVASPGIERSRLATLSYRPSHPHHPLCFGNPVFSWCPSRITSESQPLPNLQSYVGSSGGVHRLATCMRRPVRGTCSAFDFTHCPSATQPSALLSLSLSYLPSFPFLQSQRRALDVAGPAFLLRRSNTARWRPSQEQIL